MQLTENIIRFNKLGNFKVGNFDQDNKVFIFGGD